MKIKHMANDCGKKLPYLARVFFFICLNELWSFGFVFPGVGKKMCVYTFFNNCMTFHREKNLTHFSLCF